MNCPDCGGDTCVRCTRTSYDKILRYRRCKDCGNVFYTEEKITDSYNYALAEKEYRINLYRNKSKMGEKIMLEEVKSVKDRKKMLHIYALQRRGCIARHLSEDNCVLYDTEELERWKGKPGRPPKNETITEREKKEKKEIITLLTEIKELLKEMKR